jgi:uncharacterized protein YciI
MTEDARSPKATEEGLATLKSSFKRLTWYVVTLNSSGLGGDPQLLLDHLTWLKEHEARGIIVLTGLRFDEQGRSADGMTVLRAASYEEAQRLVASDPFVLAGATVTLHRWEVAAGALSFSIRLSDRSMHLV